MLSSVVFRSRSLIHKILMELNPTGAFVDSGVYHRAKFCEARLPHNTPGALHRLGRRRRPLGPRELLQRRLRLLTRNILWLQWLGGRAVSNLLLAIAVGRRCRLLLRTGGPLMRNPP